jgi:hypothetical protein
VSFVSGSRRATVASAASKAALSVLMECWPCAIDFDELLDAAFDRAAAHLNVGSAEEARRATMEDLFGGAVHGLIELHTQSPPCTAEPSDRPCAHPVAAFQARSGPFVVNAHHSMHQLDAVALDVLKMANGERHRDEMTVLLGDRLEAGRQSLDAALRTLARSALLVA